MQFPKRIQTIGNLIHDDATIADIGADHGLLEQFIVLNKKFRHILAIENKIGPLLTLRQNVECLDNVEVSHSDGLNQVGTEYDTLVLAGMGGDNIVEILSKHKVKFRRCEQIVIDAHSFIPKVREYLIDNGFAIEKEIIVLENNIYYVVISFILNEKDTNYTEDEIEFGFNLYLDPLYEKYKKHEISKYKKIAKAIKNNESQQDKYNQIENLIRRFESYGQN